MKLQFRVWDKKLKEWCFGYGCSKLDDHNLSIKFNGNLVNSYGGPTNQDRFVIQQFIGMTDKNNKEIFEGDIVSCICDNDGANESLVKIVVEIEGFKLTIDDEYSGGQDYHVGYSDFSIIGNIFENPELMKE